VGRPGPVGGVQVGLGQLGEDAAGGPLGRVDQEHVRAHQVADDPGEQRVVGAAEDQGVDLGGQQRGQVAAGQVQDLRAGGLAPLHVLDEPGAGLGDQGDVLVGLLDGLAVAARADRPLGADQAHVAVAGQAHRGPHRRLDHLDHRQRVGGPQLVEGGRRGAVAGDHGQLHILGHQQVHDLLGEPPHLGLRPGPVREPGGVAEVDHRLVGQQVDDGPGDGQPANPGVEDADRSWIHGAGRYRSRATRHAQSWPRRPASAATGSPP
jgi:hypothetical protein